MNFKLAVQSMAATWKNLERLQAAGHYSYGEAVKARGDFARLRKPRKRKNARAS